MRIYALLIFDCILWDHSAHYPLPNSQGDESMIDKKAEEYKESISDGKT